MERRFYVSRTEGDVVCVRDKDSHVAHRIVAIIPRDDRREGELVAQKIVDALHGVDNKYEIK